MCLTNIWSKEEQKQWLEKQPDEITAYKIVFVHRRLHGTDLFPLYNTMPTGTFQRVNDQTHQIRTIYSVSLKGERDSRSPYEAHFHLFLTKQAAQGYFRANEFPNTSYAILKCKVPKKHIIHVGTQGRKTTIITKYFEFVEGDQYFQQDTPRKTAGKRTCA
jgi:hypothetical protein